LDEGVPEQIAAHLSGHVQSVRQLGLKGVTNGRLLDALEQRSEELVTENWPAIEVLAQALLEKSWEPLKPLRSGAQWSNQAMAKYVTRDEAFNYLNDSGSAAVCVFEC